MSKSTRNRLLSLLLLLGALTGVFASPQQAEAVQCCEFCLYFYENCLANPTVGPCYANAACCDYRLAECEWTCYWC